MVLWGKRGDVHEGSGAAVLADVSPVPARYVRHSQMCPHLDMSDKIDKQMQDMSDKAKCVRQKLQQIAIYAR